MNIFEFAREKELLSRESYLQMAEKTSSEGLKNMLGMLADEESRHYEIVTQMEKSSPAAVADSDLLTHAAEIFRNMSRGVEKFGFETNEIDLYEKARENEEASRDFYLSQAEAAGDPAAKEIFKKLAAEEQKHFVLLDNLFDFVSRPLTYLEDAQFTYLDDYVQKPL